MSEHKGQRPQAGNGASGELLRAILDSASQAILTVNAAGVIQMANAQAGEMFGHAPAELVGQGLETLMPEAARAAHARHRADYFDRPRVREMGAGFELAARSRDGSEFPVEISLSHVRSDNGMLAIAFVTDITQRKRLEEQLLQSQKLEAVGRLAGGVAHDFNNLLTIILGYNSQLLSGISPFDPLRGCAEEVQRASERAAALTKQLLAFSRRQPIQPKVISLNDVLAGVHGMLRRVVPESVEIVLRLRPDVGNVKVDRTQMEQVILNLIVNAGDAMPGGGRVLIETQQVTLDQTYSRTHLGVQPGEYAMLAVTDTGSGMDAETRRHIFEPFFTTKPPDQGTGMGLATVYGIVKQNRGDIWVYSEPGKGATFKVYIPLAYECAEATGPVPESDPPEAITETILVVEDEPAVRRLIFDALRQSGYGVLEAADSLEAIHSSKQHQGAIHLLLTDVVMPHSNARDMARQIAATRPGLKTLYMSGYTEDTILHHGIVEAGIEFLPKPFAVATLLKRVREVLSDARGRTSAMNA